MMVKRMLPHIITVTSFVLFIVLGLACATTEPGSSPGKQFGEFVKSAILPQSQSSGTQRSAEEYYKRGDENLRNGNYEQAIEDFTEAIRLNPNSPSSYNNRAWVYAYHLKTNFDQAISDATQAIRLSPNEPNHFGTRGWAYLGKGDYDSATDDFFKALELGSNAPEVREGLRIIREAQAEEEIDWSMFE